MKAMKVAIPVLTVLALLVIGAVLARVWLEKGPAALLQSVRTDSDALLPEEDTAQSYPSLTLSQSTDRIFTGACGEPQTVDIVAAVHGFAEDLEGIRAARLTYWWEGGDEHSMTMEREADDRFFAEIGPFDYCCGETPLFYTVELLDRAGGVLKTGRNELLLTHCEDEPGELPLSLALQQSTDVVFAGDCGGPSTADIVARLEGPAEALESVHGARLTYHWEGGDEHALTMERRADDLFFAEIGPFNYCCDEMPLFFTVTLLGAAGEVLKRSGGDLLLIYCQEEVSLGSAGLPRIEGASLLTLGPYAVDDAETSLRAANDRFTELTGIEVVYESTAYVGEALAIGIEVGETPDVAFLTEPGLVRRYAEAGQLVPLSPRVIARAEENYAPAWLELGSYQGRLYGIFRRVSPKSLVWYPKAYFQEADYQVPQTWDELVALSGRIVADGATPWCVGIESWRSQGWVATDWIEDALLRTSGPQIYDQWWQHQIPFDDERVLKAGAYVEEIWFNDDFVLGGRTGILESHFAEAALPMWNDPPGCYLFRQASSVPRFWPEQVRDTLDERAGVFVLPPIDPAYGAPLLVGGDQAVMFNDRPEVQAYMEYLAMGISVEPAARAGSGLFPHRDQDLSWYPSDLERTMAELAMTVEVVRFDASELMPREIGAGAFWNGMVDWVEGAELETVLEAIEESWP